MIIKPTFGHKSFSLNHHPARAVSFISFFLLCTNYALVLILNDYAARVRHLIMPEMLLWSSTGMIASGLLCPFFLPLPSAALTSGNRKPVKTGIKFIILIMLPNIILRSLGVELWLSSLAARSLIHFLTGMLYPICCGLFIFSFLPPNAQVAKSTNINSKNLTGKYCVLLFSIAWGSILLIRYISMPLFEFFGGTEPLTVTTLAYNTITVLIACIAVFVITSLILLDKEINAKPQEFPSPEPALQTDGIKASGSNWYPIIILICLTVIYQIVNTLLDMRFHELTLTHVPGTELFRFLALAVIVTVMGFFAGFSLQKFLSVFLPFAVILIILLPCLLLFDENPPQFAVILRDMTGSAFYRIMAAVWTVVIAEQYLSIINSGHMGSKRTGFWFYMLAGYFNITNIILMFSEKISELVPSGSGYTIFFLGIAAVLFMLLSYRIIFPHIPAQSIALPIIKKTKLDDIFREYGLTEIEMEVASLIINEGLSNEKIAEKLFRSVDAIKARSTGIYSKFNVRGRVELMALIVKKMNEE